MCVRCRAKLVRLSALTSAVVVPFKLSGVLSPESLPCRFSRVEGEVRWPLPGGSEESMINISLQCDEDYNSVTVSYLGSEPRWTSEFKSDPLRPP